MKFTCLSKGRGFHFPPCHIFNLCGFTILVDCPLDLSSLAIFSPVPTDSCTMLDEESFSFSNQLESADPKRQKLERPLHANNLIKAEPWYKTVKNLHLWNKSFIDIILVSSPMGMLGLPFLTRAEDFSAKIYVTEAASRFGQLMMEDLVSMHKEFKHFYGPEDFCFPRWMKWEELESLPCLLKEIALGKDGTELGGWMPLYSAADVKQCIQKVQALKYAEETCYNGTLIIEAFSSGLEIGTCNWLITGPQGTVVCLSSSLFDSTVAMNFNYHALQGNDLTLYSDFSFLTATGDSEDRDKFPVLRDDNDNSEALDNILVSADDNSEEMEKLAYICSRTVESVKAGGSVLIPIGRIGTILEILELVSFSIESSDLKVPIFVVSSVAEELLALTNTIPEWLCKQRQDKLYSGQTLFTHVELVKEKRIHLFPAIYSRELLTMWQEPCIVFAPHLSLRLGPAVHLLRRWGGDCNSLLVLEEGLNVDLALLPFKPLAMNVCQCSFLSGIKLQKIKPLLNVLQAKSILMPDDLRRHVVNSDTSSFSFIHYSENETLHIPILEECHEVKIAPELIPQTHFRRLNQKHPNIIRLKGDLYMDHGKYWLHSGNDQMESSLRRRPLFHWGSLNLSRLLTVLQEMGISGSVVTTDADGSNHSSIRIDEPEKALIEVRATSTVISAADEKLASHIFEAIDTVLDGI